MVTAFRLGLGLGSLLGRWISKRRGLPLLPLLALIELMTGGFGLVSLKVFKEPVTDDNMGSEWRYSLGLE